MALYADYKLSLGWPGHNSESGKSGAFEIRAIIMRETLLSHIHITPHRIASHTHPITSLCDGPMTMAEVNAVNAPLSHCSLVTRCCEAGTQEGDKASWGFKLRYISWFFTSLSYRHWAIYPVSFYLLRKTQPNHPFRSQEEFALDRSTSRRLISKGSD
jgi:hypothetical protein